MQNSLTRPYLGLYSDFGFAGCRSCNKDGNNIDSSCTNIEGINGEVAWILVSDGKTCMLHGDTRLSKASPVSWLEYFWSEYLPECKNKRVIMDQGGKLYKNKNLIILYSSYGFQPNCNKTQPL